MKNLTIVFFLQLSALSLLAQNAPNNPCPALVSDYDGHRYNTLYIGGRCWMKENLRTTHYADGAKASYIHANYSKDNDSIYGLLYDWQTAKGVERGKQGICPDGWYLPSDWE